MDDEHQECTDSFNKVLENPTADNLLDLYNVLKEHFDHEEKLMMEYSETKSDASSSFSAINSHKNDHDRILNIAKEELDRLNVCEYKTKKWHKQSADLAQIRELTDAFHVHAERFDVLYQANIPAAAQ